MSRKVYLDITCKTMVPIISHVKAIVVVEEGANLKKIAQYLVTGKPNVYHGAITVEDLSTESLGVDGDIETQGLNEDIIDFITADEENGGGKVKFIDYKVDDSK